MSAQDSIEAPQVVAQEQKVVGDENVPAAREPQVEVVAETADAKVSQPREGAADKVQVHETSVVTDERVDYVIIPDAGRGDLSLPIHRLDRPRPEDVFAEHAAGQDDSEPAPADEPEQK